MLYDNNCVTLIPISERDNTKGGWSSVAKARRAAAKRGGSGALWWEGAHWPLTAVPMLRERFAARGLRSAADAEAYLAIVVTLIVATTPQKVAMTCAITIARSGWSGCCSSSSAGLSPSQP